MLPRCFLPAFCFSTTFIHDALVAADFLRLFMRCAIRRAMLSLIHFESTRRLFRAAVHADAADVARYVPLFHGYCCFDSAMLDDYVHTHVIAIISPQRRALPAAPPLFMLPYLYFSVFSPRRHAAFAMILLAMPLLSLPLLMLDRCRFADVYAYGYAMPAAAIATYYCRAMLDAADIDAQPRHAADVSLITPMLPWRVTLRYFAPRLLPMPILFA